MNNVIDMVRSYEYFRFVYNLILISRNVQFQHVASSLNFRYDRCTIVVLPTRKSLRLGFSAEKGGSWTMITLMAA